MLKMIAAPNGTKWINDSKCILDGQMEILIDTKMHMNNNNNINIVWKVAVYVR